ncbi:hypothetical protein [Micromonospora sp. DT31]|uniref:hypothetical protein n=1 Tax=Micromonospora sp. DT31 TaxID=3393434 RepID=UPI003CF44333
MHARRSGRPADRAESERLLDAAATPAADADPLARLLAAAAAAPPAGTPTAGEEQALAAFRAARAAPAPAVARRRPRRRLRVAAALSGLAATTVAGVAFAAVRLDRPTEPVPPPATSRPTGAAPTEVPPATGPITTDPSPASTAPTGEMSPATPSPTPTAPVASDPPPAGDRALAGHCRAYLAKSERQRERALTTPGFADLVTAAGGPDQVERFCRDLVAAPSEPADEDD